MDSEARRLGVPILLLCAAAVGAAGACATYAFREAIGYLETMLGGRNVDVVELAIGMAWPMRVLTPALGGLIAGVLLLIAKRRAKQVAVSDYMEVISVGGGMVPVEQSLWRSTSSLVSIATGSSIGREGAMVQLSALFASMFGRLLRITSTQLSLLAACGAAAGVSSAYGAPIAGTLFVTELLFGTLAMEILGPLLVAAVVANIVMRELPGYEPAYEMPMFPNISGPELLWFLLLGAISGVLSPLFLRALELSKRGFKRLNLPLPIRLALGGLGVGVLSIWVPQVWGNGYSVVNGLLHSHWACSTVLMILLFKVIATALSTGSGAVGGVFTPTLFMGAAFGYLFSSLAHTIWPDVISAPAAYVMVGMGAFLAASTHAPLMAILIIFEMTLNYAVVLPLMLACVVAYFVARSSAQMPMYEVVAKRRLDADRRLRLRSARMLELIRPTETVLTLDATFEDTSKVFLAHPVKYIYVLDEAKAYVGVVTFQDIASALKNDPESHGQAVATLVRTRELGIITPDMSLPDALQHFAQHPGERLPAVDPTTRKLLGVVHKSTLLEACMQLTDLGAFKPPSPL
ncbi:ClcB-like voltage-gated chloride channel protein [Pandoraea sp. NE5]|uniref:ClcB-like voltage-gated chloride channel protein n=1 Tax=Pandoraea sp. NE5 TaxID=2904129 RepID=UPI003965C33D